MRGNPNMGGSTGRVVTANATAYDNVFTNQTPQAPIYPGRPVTGAVPQAQVLAAGGADLAQPQRGGIGNNVLGDQPNKRTRLDIGGTSARALAAMRGTPLGGNAAPQQMGPSPDLARLQLLSAVQPGGGQPIANGMPTAPPEFYTRGINFSARAADGALGGMPGKPTYFDPVRRAPGGAGGLAGTQSGSQFITPGGGVQSTVGGISNPFLQVDYAALAAQKTTRSDDLLEPNQTAKYNVTLDRSTAAAIATVALKHNVMFQFCQLQAQPTPSQRRFRALAAPMPEVKAYTLPVLNYLLATEQTRPLSLAEVVETDFVLDRYKLVGVPVGEEGQLTTKNFERGTNNVARNLALVLTGPAVVFNYWPGAQLGSMVGFILRGVPLRHIYAINERDRGSYNISADKQMEVRKLDTAVVSQCPLQLVPWYDPKGMARVPPLSDLLYIDEFGVERKGEFIPFGYFLQLFQSQLPDSVVSERAPFSMAATAASGTCRVDLDSMADLRI